MAETTSINDFTLGFQIKYCLVIIISLTGTNLYLYQDYLQHDLGKSYFETLLTLSQLEHSLVYILIITFILQSLLTFLCTLVLGHLFTRKISGIVYRFEHLLRAIAAGNLQHVARNRDCDQIKSLFAALNSLIISIRNVYLSVQNIDLNLHQFIQQLESGRNPDRNSLRQQIAQARILLKSRNSQERIE